MKNRAEFSKFMVLIGHSIKLSECSEVLKITFFLFVPNVPPFQPPLISVPTVWHPLELLSLSSLLQVPFKH